MKKHKFIFCLLSVVLLQINLSLKAQIFSEAPVTISDKGERLSNMIYLKIKSSGFTEINEKSKIITGQSISNKFSNIRKTISDFCRNNQLELLNIRISKAIPGAKDEDTLFTVVRTGELRILPNLSRVYIIKFPKQVDIERLSSELMKNDEVEFSHGPIQTVNCAEYPNDQYYTNGDQWYLNTINAPNAWGITQGSLDIKIALIETSGVELTHSDLQAKIIGGDNNPAGILDGHGTSVSGFAGAVTHNSVGVASLGWNTKLLTYQPNNDNEERAVLAQKIKDAADAGAHVINLSFKTIKTGFTSCSFFSKSSIINNSMTARYYYYNWDYDLVHQAINYAVGKNSVVIASAGNENSVWNDYFPCENIPYPCYPAQYSNVIAVSGSQQNNNFVDGWNYGTFVDVNAPGRTDANTGLWSTDLNNGYTNSVSKTSGTSFSAPQVSALAALIKSINTSLTPSQVKTTLENSADKVGQYSYSNGRNDYFGYGRINAYKALKYTLENYGGTLAQTLTVPSGETWNFQPGVTVKFANGASLIVNGTLNAVGNSTNKITFTRSGSSGTWGGIKFNSGSSGSVQ
jgi:hypothetical protein